MTATPLVIVCAGGYARETAAAIETDPRWALLGFADDDRALHGRDVDGLPVLGSPEEVIEKAPEAEVVVCQARPDRSLRSALVARLQLPSTRYAAIVHPRASLARSSTVGPGTVVLAGVVATAANQIGSHVAIMPGAVIEHDAVIDDYATIGAGAVIGGGARIGSGAYLAMGALVREGITIGAGALIGMGAVVTRSVPPGETWFGVPARARAPLTESAAPRSLE